MQNLWMVILLMLLACCRQRDSIVNGIPESAFMQPVKVEIKGYTGNIMEPFLSRDGNSLLFNNLNSPPENTNLHWAIRINDTSFKYQGEIAGLNTGALEGVPTLDNTGNLYFVSTRNYTATLATIYQCDFLNGTAKNVQLTEGVSKLQAGWVNFDVEVSADGQSLYFVDSKFDQSGNPFTADLVLAQKSGAGFLRSPNSSALLKNINTDALEYAACISADDLELYFTRVTALSSGATYPEILVSTRQHKNEAFGSPLKINGITGFAEAPTISPDQQKLYYHKKESNKFVLYMIKKK